MYVDRLRDERDLSLRELAKRLGCSAPFLSDVVHGRRYPSDEMLGKIALELGVSEGDLREHDLRPPIDEIKRRSRADPKLAVAFRTVIEKNVSGEELMKWIEESRSGKEPKK
jgi:transcriptional regulator with XRE-family HTH domain